MRIRRQEVRLTTANSTAAATAATNQSVPVTRVDEPGPHPGDSAARGVQGGHDVHEHPERGGHPRDPVPGDHPVQPGAAFQPRGAGGEDEPAEGGQGGQEPGELADRQRRVDAPGEQRGEPAGQDPEAHGDGGDPSRPGGGIDGCARAPRAAARRALGRLDVPRIGAEACVPALGARSLAGGSGRVGESVRRTPCAGARRWFEHRCHASMLASRRRLGEGQTAVREPPLRSPYTSVNWPCCPYRTTIQLLSGTGCQAVPPAAAASALRRLRRPRVASR